jgi:hypothetical protein
MSAPEVLRTGGNAVDGDEKKMRALEGLGYCAAFMIILGGITDQKALDWFNILGLAFAIIVIVRLMVMSISMGLVQRLYENSGSLESGISQLDEET